MAVVTIPPIKQSAATMGLQRADNALQMMNGADVITEFARAVWTYQFSLVPQKEASGMLWAGALARLSRISNHFEAGPPGYNGAAYTATTLQVDGSGQLGIALDIKGAQPSTKVLQAGEYFEINGELKIVVSDCTSDGSGLATVQFEPPLRDSPDNSANLNTQTPKAKFRLATPESSWSIGLKKYYRIQIDCVEVI